MSKYNAKSYTDKEIEWLLVTIAKTEKTWDQVSEVFNKKFSRNRTGNALRKTFEIYKNHKETEPEELKLKMPKILIYDIETAPLLSYCWGMWQQNIGLNQIKEDWHVLSWCAKWLDSDDTMYMDQRDAKDITNDKKLLKGIWDLLDEADFVITQNGKKFDDKKLNARFVLNGMKPPSSYKNIDTLIIAKKHFAFTSNKLAYMTDKLCSKYKKSGHAKFPGFQLWSECLKGNLEAWKEMEAYNLIDVLSLEELYHKLIPWDNTFDFNLYHDGLEHICTCGHSDLKKNGFHYTNASKFQKYNCSFCGKEYRDTVNLLSKAKRKSLMKRTLR